MSFQLSHNHMQCSPSHHVGTNDRPQPSKISPRPTSIGPVPQFLSASRIRISLRTSANPALRKRFPNQSRHSLLTARASSAQKQIGESRDSRDALWKIPAAFAAAALCENFLTYLSYPRYIKRKFVTPKLVMHEHSGTMMTNAAAPTANHHPDSLTSSSRSFPSNNNVTALLPFSCRVQLVLTSL